ncbi:MAG: LysE family translocator [Rhodobacteraceae bacterium]|nr:LysE family translocator [Paracoccaceae bacterium]
MTAASFLAVALLSLMAAVSPGPAVIMAARTGLTEGFRTGALLAAGIGLGAVIWAGAAMFGLKIIFTAAPAALTLLKLAGGAYLVWMGIGLWRGAHQPIAMGDATTLPRHPADALWRGLATQLANPKPAVMFSAIFLGTLPADTPAWQYGALLAVVFCNETLWNIAVARIFSLDRARRGYIRLKSTIDRVFGAALALLGVKVALI